MNTPEAMKGAGFTDWKRHAEASGNLRLARLAEQMDSRGNPGENAHRSITERLAELELPVQRFTKATVEEFLNDPIKYFSELPIHGEYYFVSIIPGRHLAHASHAEEVISFVKDYMSETGDGARELYLSYNGEPVMSGHIMVKDDGELNTVYGEFTIGNFNAFHRGSHAPEIVVKRDWRRFVWDFRGTLEHEGDWRDDELFYCNGDVQMTRQEMAQRAYDALARIPRDGDRYLPGYYEVLLEHQGGGITRPAFIEANFSAGLSV